MCNCGTTPPCMYGCESYFLKPKRKPRPVKTIEEHIAAGWQQRQCNNCSGYGVVSVYSMYDFEGPGECNTCKGGGVIWDGPKGVLAMYPGGPLLGRLTLKELNS